MSKGERTAWQGKLRQAIKVALPMQPDRGASTRVRQLTVGAFKLVEMLAGERRPSGAPWPTIPENAWMHAGVGPTLQGGRFKAGSDKAFSGRSAQQRALSALHTSESS